MDTGWLIREGRTSSGEYVWVYRDEGGPYGVFTVIIHGVNIGVDRVDRLRDGGTTILNLTGGRRIVFPHKLGVEDRVPKLDDMDIT